MSADITETAWKVVTLGGCPSIAIQRQTPTAAGRPAEYETLAVFKNDENGNQLADELCERFNKGKIRF